MSRNFCNITKLFYKVPIVDITYKYKGKIRHVYASLEWFSLTGSIKDRVAYAMIESAFLKGKLKERDKIVEVSSGNMGLSLTAISKFFNLEPTIIMPISASEERKKLIKMYGAKLVLTKDYKEAFKLCKDYVKAGYICLDQFSNFDNLKVHYSYSAKNFIKTLKNKKIGAFVCGVGTSGTLSGVGKRLKEKLGVSVYATQPENSRLLTKSPPYRKHLLEGLSDEIVPLLYDKKIVDKVIQVSDKDAIAMARKLSKELALGVGISSGANFIGAIESNTNVVTVFPDDNKKYLSTKLTQEISSDLVDKVEFISLKVLPLKT